MKYLSPESLSCSQTATDVKQSEASYDQATITGNTEEQCTETSPSQPGKASAELLESHAKALGEVAAYHSTWSPLRERHERSLVNTSSGKKCGDPYLSETFKPVKNKMDELLDTLYAHNVFLGKNALEDAELSVALAVE